MLSRVAMIGHDSAQAWTPEKVYTSGLVMGATGAMTFVARWTPKTVVRGVQLSLGAMLAIQGAKMISSWWLLGLASVVIVLALVGKELGFERPDSDVFTGDGLARCVSNCVPEVRHSLRLLVRKSSLRSGNYIRVCGGTSDAGAVEDEATLRTCEFELTPHFRERLKIKKQRRSKNSARKPLVRMRQLVLSDGVHRALDMVSTRAGTSSSH